MRINEYFELPTKSRVGVILAFDGLKKHYHISDDLSITSVLTAVNHGTSFPLTSTSSVLQADALQVVYDAFRGHTRQDARKVLLHFEPDAADDETETESKMRQLLDDDVTVVFIGN